MNYTTTYSYPEMSTKRSRKAVLDYKGFNDFGRTDYNVIKSLKVINNWIPWMYIICMVIQLALVALMQLAI